MLFNILFILLWGWGLGIGDWGLGIGDWANPQSHPQSPIPNPQSPMKYFIFKFMYKCLIYYYILIKNK